MRKIKNQSMCVFWIRKTEKVTVCNCMNVQELRDTFFELLMFLKKLVDYYDKNPKKRQIIELGVGKNLESIIAGVEHTLYCFDRFKSQLESNLAARVQFTMQAITVKEDLEEIKRHMLRHRDWNASSQG